MTREIAQKIVEKAVALNFERCGIVGVDKMREYGTKVATRIERFPKSAGMYRQFLAFAEPERKYPWARSVVICSWRQGVYRIPKGLDGMIGKSYLFDERRDRNSEGYRARTKFERYMIDDLGLRVAASHDYGIASCRWAACVSGIGTIRGNNFFYGDHGSYYSLVVFLVDEDMEYAYESTYKPCSDNCNLCVKHCPTEALAEPYATCGVLCASYLTNKAPDNGAFENYASQIGGRLYGCDVCQDVCPFNKGQWAENKDFPGLEKLSADLSPEKIVAMDYAYLREVFAPKFWYIEAEDLWKWKRNALYAMRNTQHENYGAALTAALNDENERVRRLAKEMSAVKSGEESAK
jgi:epoxyqueuosine reductase